MSADYAFAGAAISAVASRRPSSPRRRVHISHQPPPLSTAIAAHHPSSLQQRQHASTPHALTPTPSSAVSMSSPFSTYNPATFSPGNSSGNGVPPRNMAAVPQPSNSLFNPQQWQVPVAGNSPAVASGYVPYAGQAIRSSAVLDGVDVVPPPPYSPRRPDSNQQQQPPSAPVATPAQNISPVGNTVQYTTSISATSTSPPALPHIQTSLPTQERSTHPHAPYFPPPPPVSAERRQRNSSKTRNERPQTLFGLSAFTGRRPSNSPAPAPVPAPVPAPAPAPAPAANPSRASVVIQDGTPRAHIAGNNLAAPGAYNTGRRGSIALSPTSTGFPPADQMPPPPPGPPPPQWQPPSARRAASTGAIGHMSPGPSRSQSRSPASGAWEPGMPLPPPPRAPPPNTRSQSMTRTPTDGSSSSRGSFSNPVAVMPTRRPLAQESSLPTIPPTPAGWIDEDAPQRGRSPNPAGRGLRVDTSQIASRTSSTGYDEDFTASAESARSVVSAASSFGAYREQSEGSPPGGLVRTRAVRDQSAKGIRERRVESRIGKAMAAEPSSAIEPSNNPWAGSMEPEPLVLPADIVIPTGPGCGVQRRRTITRSTPRSANTPGSLKTPTSPGNTESEQSRSTTPRPESSRVVGMAPPAAATPPFSPGHAAPVFPREIDGSLPALPPKALPTPPLLQQRHDSFVSTTSSLELPAPSSGRPVSHLLHIPNAGAVELQPLSPVRPSSGLSSRQTRQSRLSSHDTPQSPTRDEEDFVHAAIERHNSFTRREAAAKTDRERVELFAEFIVGESRIRRERYAAAMDSMGSEILELTRDLFKPPGPVRRYNGLSPTVSSGGDWPRDSPQTASTHRTSLSATVHSSYPSSPMAVHPPKPPDSPLGNVGNNSQNRPETAWWGQYMPSLSPIPSVSVSDMRDEMSSRGRPPSRWWEASQEGSVGNGSRGVGRSRRESKYMGVPREARESLQWEAEGRSNSSSGRGSGKTASGPTTQNGWHSADEYPPEKVDANGPAAPPPPQSFLPASSMSPQYRPLSSSSDQNKLDISRLITLPPPHPRHHPAVNNNHPDLTAIRTVARSLGDFTEIQTVRDSYAVKSERLQEEAQNTSRRRNSLLRGDIQRKIEAGSMSYSEAARLEAEFEAEEGEKKKQRVQAEFDRFQNEVVKVLNALLLQRITTATASFDQLRSKLFVDAQEGSPNMTQEEGDEQPELLEKLTLLKWLFEVRESLHREVYDLLSERNEKYKVMVMTPYRLSGKEDKIREAESFFQKDGQDRKVAFEKETLKRVEDFMDVIEQNVIRGVEVQLSAFWDIAPPLLDVIKKIPQDLDAAVDSFGGGFSIQIPQSEYDENPSYHSHPLQYLYSLLSHAGKSTYQFIESQTNLLCLLHEVKSAVAAANCRCLELGSGMGENVVEELRREEEKRLTDDLKEKVRTVEEQWQEALGRTLEGAKERVKGVLVRDGGWGGVEDEEEGFISGGD